MNDDIPLDQWRLVAVEQSITELRDTAVSREWLDERLGRVEDAISAGSGLHDKAREAIRRDVAELQARDKARRNAVYVAVVGSIASIVVALVTAGAMA